MIRIDTSDLQLLVATVDTGSLSAAARRIHLSPAAASERMSSLEERMGHPLFVRRRTGLQPTDSGHRLARHARQILRQLEQVQTEFDGLRSENQGHVRIAANTSAVTEFMPHILGRYMAERPRVSVDLFERPHREVVRSVLQEEVDFGIVGAGEMPREMQRLKFASDRMVLVAPTTHPLGPARPLHYQDALDHPQVSLDAGTSYGEFMRDIRHRVGWQPRTRIELRSFEALCFMISAGVGVGVVPESVARRHAQTLPLALYPLKDPWARRDRYIIAQDFQALSGAAHALVLAIGRHFKRRFGAGSGSLKPSATPRPPR